MTLSSFNPIRFNKSGSKRDARCCVSMTFAESDRIMIQAYHSSNETVAPLEITDKHGIVFGSTEWKRYVMNQDVICSVVFISGLPSGIFSLKCGTLTSDEFGVAPIGKLEDTVLLQYAQTDNTERNDIVTLFNGNILYYEARIPGGFKDSGWMFNVDNEQFFTPRSDLVEYSAVDYTDKTLTIGSSSGIDVVMAETVNRILSCPLLFVDGKRYTRPDSTILEMTSEVDKDRFVYSALLREAHYLNPKLEYLIRLNLRRTPHSVRRTDKFTRRIS